MKRTDFLKSTTAAGRGSVTEIHKSAAQCDANRIPAGRLWRVVRTGLAALTVSFLVSVGQATAAPGEAPIRIQLRDKHPRVGHPVRLRALNLPAEHKHVLWYLEAQPPGSKAKFHNQTSSEALFVPDVLGLFRVRLTDGSDWTRTATLDVTVTPALPPLLPVNTITVNAAGQPGMMVGGTFYADPGNGTGFHVLVLDRNSPDVMEYNYSVPFDANQISTGLNFTQFPDSYLVLLALPASAGPVPESLIAAVDAALGEIGGFLPEQPRWLFASNGPCWSSNLLGCYTFNALNGVGYEAAQWNTASSNQGSFSVIGVPGMAAGNAWYDDAAQRGTTNGPLVGYLLQGSGVGAIDNPSAYQFVFSPDQYVLVDSCASGWPSACVIQVGSQTFPPTAPNGVHVVVLDRVTLKLLTDQTVTSTQALFSALGDNRSPEAGHEMPLDYDGASGSFTDRVVVVMQSVGTGALTYDAATPLLQVVDELGGTPETLGTAITKGLPYALIGVMSNLPWHGKGIESSPAIVLGQGSTTYTLPGHARGALARDRLARYTPTANDPTGNANLDLLPIVYQNPTPWPYAGSCSIEYLAVKLGLATDGGDPNAGGNGLAGNTDIRSAYPNQNESWTDKDPFDWPYPTTDQFPWYCPQSSFLTPQDYSSLQQRINSEIGWVGDTNNLIKNLGDPFTQSQAAGNTIVDSVAVQVAESIPAPPQATTSFSWLDVFNLGSAVATAVGADEAAAAIGLVAASGQIAVDSMASSSTGNPATNVIAVATAEETEANNFKTQLYNQTEAHLIAVGSLFDILVTDAGKLETVGSNIDTATTNQGGPWYWGSTATGNVVRILNATTTQMTYSALVPPTWPVYNLKPNLSAGQYSSNNVSTFVCGFSNAYSTAGWPDTFKKALTANQFQALIQLVAGQKPSETSTTEVWTFATVKTDNFGITQASATVPSTSLTATLFATQSATAFVGAAYPPAWWRSTYNPPSLAYCGANYNASETSGTYQAPPPVIPPPAAAYGQQ